MRAQVRSLWAVGLAHCHLPPSVSHLHVSNFPHIQLLQTFIRSRILSIGPFGRLCFASCLDACFGVGLPCDAMKSRRTLLLALCVVCVRACVPHFLTAACLLGEGKAVLPVLQQRLMCACQSGSWMAFLALSIAVAAVVAVVIIDDATGVMSRGRPPRQPRTPSSFLP